VPTSQQRRELSLVAWRRRQRQRLPVGIANQSMANSFHDKKKLDSLLHVLDKSLITPPTMRKIHLL
jgi:hypothetical protein